MKILTKTKWKAFEQALIEGPDEAMNIIKQAGLTGRSGGSFPTAKKLELTKIEDSPEKYLICNAHEGEPGTFKDKFIIEKNPDIIIEGIAIACFIIGATNAIIYFKHGYPNLVKKLKNSIKKSEIELNKINLKIEILTGAATYICGEATSVIDSIEGLRGEPRHQPPYPSEKGLYGKPTCVNNLETLSNIPVLFVDNAWDDKIHLFSVSGDVKKPGVYEEQIGCNIDKILKKARPKGKPKAIYFGCSGGLVKPEGKLCNDYLCMKGASLGCSTLIIINENKSIIDITKNIAEFYVHGSCGKCTPCREGTFRILEIIDKISDGKGTGDDIKLLEKLADYIPENSFCGLGKTSTNHIKTALKNFRNEFELACKKKSSKIKPSKKVK